MEPWCKRASQLTLTFGFLVLLRACTGSVTCPSGYSRNGNLCYSFHRDPKSFDDANVFCKTDGGQELVSWNNDDAIGRFLQDRARDILRESAYIGLRDIHNNGRYYWMDRRTEYSKTPGSRLWDPHEPSTADERCVQLDAGKGYKLNDVSCDVPFAFVCKACSVIDKCVEPECRSGPDSRSTSCRKCQPTYKPTPDRSQCEEACEYNNPCWPGRCAGNYLRNCVCTNGFREVTHHGRNHCQLGTSMHPELETCRMKVFVNGGKMTDSPSNSTSTLCANMMDFYGNYQPEVVNLYLMTSFTVDVKSFPESPGAYQTIEANFGVTDVKVQLLKKTVTGPTISDSQSVLLADSSQGRTVNNTFSRKTNLTYATNLSNGDRLCAEIEVKGGGYMRTKDTWHHNRDYYYEYDKTTTLRSLCYIMDTGKPLHQSEMNSSLGSPLEISEHITRTGLVNVSFTDWIDPIPTGGDPTLASGIEKYEITLYDLKYAHGTQSVGSIIRSKYLNGTESPMMELNLTFSQPKLVCILLEVKDVADNVGFARRFVLFDNTSRIAVETSKSFTVTSASPASHLKWQTHHNEICMSWRDYFINKVYMNNHFLDPINPDPNIPDRYDQGSGELPVSGTPNVHGVTAFHFSWIRNGGEPHNEGPVSNFLNQTLCTPIPLLDGETYTLNITAIDVVNNSITESRTVSIDRTVPHINNIWLVNEGQESLFVHGDENGDLNELTISFEVLDPHSGVEEIQWAFGTADGKMDIASSKISVNETDSCSGISDCICPSVGLCQVTKYSVSMRGINLKAGDHNRNYYFTIKATNHARLSNIEHMEILVDISPPETGVVFEGPHGSSDLDYTSSPDFMVRWHGFVDHESGIMGYQIALAKRCLTKHEMRNTKFLSSFNTTIEEFHETSSTENSVKMNATFTGKYHVTVVAINNAAQLSEPACSDGITRDVTRPTLSNLTLTNGRWRETVHCMDNTAWLLHSSLVKIRLDDVSDCMQLCHNETSLFQVPGLIPELPKNVSDEMISEFICRRYDQYTDNEFIYLPNDHLELTWDIDEDGSQIEEIYVGLGTDQSQAVSPNLMAYTPTNRRSFYRQSHAGFSTDDPFYAFVKVTNKADIDSISSLGPIIIDETPPVKMTTIEVMTNQTHVVVGWENQTFVDPEQLSPISSIFFQIESEGEAISPLLEWNLHDSPSCIDYSGGCITYPVRRLQDKDTIYGRYYAIALHVFNNAGHELRTSTNNFRIPSKYPPGHGRVTDIDPSIVTQNPNDIAMVTDISAHTTNNTLCSTWTGFEHHEGVSFEIGVGTSPDTDTVYSFQHIHDNGSACLHSRMFHTNVKYFVSIRATCSGGATITSSDGVMIVNVTEITDALVVRNGRDCMKLSNRQTAKPTYHGNNITAEINDYIVSVNTSTLSNNSFFINRPLRVGFTYFLQMYENELRKPVGFETSDGMAEVIDEFWYKVVPYSDIPSFRFVNNYTITSEYSILVHECYNGSYLDDSSVINGYWSLDINVSLPFTFEIAIGIDTSSNKINTSDIRQISLFEKANSDEYASLAVNSTDPGAVFRMLVRPCIENLCLPYVASPGVKFIGRPVEFEIIEAMLTAGNCSNVEFKLSITYTDDISFYQWTITRDLKATHILDDWRTVLMDKGFYNISACTPAQVHDRETLYVCVRAFSWSSSSALTCSRLNTVVMENGKKQLVYEFDTTQPSWLTTKQLLNSRFLGEKTTEMLDSELDFGNSSSIVASAISLASERNVTWYLMTSKYVPDTCSTSHDCITYYTTTSSGYTIFQPEVIPTNRVLYSCVFSNVTVLYREQHVETLDEIKSCSDGFIIDTVNPSAGDLVVPNHNRYITDVRRTVIYWDGFTDNMDTGSLGYPSPIKQYVVFAGSTAGGDDLLPLTNVGYAPTYMLDEMDQPDGTSFFLTVTGTDHAGLQVSVTSDMLMLDTSPPSSGRVHIQGTSGTMSVISADILNIHLSGFNDPHSGIDHFEIGIGSQSRVADLVPVRTYATNYVIIVLKDFQPADGRQYFVIVQAINRAGLRTDPVSTSFIIDRTPPSGGHVLDGAPTERKDLDNQDNGTYIAGHWYGFTDHHSGILYYRVGLGSRPRMDDLELFTEVGLTTNVKWRRSLTPGAKYYITVEACNGARLCKQVSSDGIKTDQSAPIPGQVRVGYQGNHGKYQSKNTSVHVQWSGFSDTESGIDHFEVCLGTGPDICDVHSFFNALLSSSITKTGLNIPGDRDVYAIVKAFNNVGMSAMVASDLFRVDFSPPIRIETPSIVNMNSLVNNSNIHYDPSFLRLHWKFEDYDSPITSHFVTLKTHHEGHTPIENLELGPVDGVTISLDKPDWLHDGDTYFVIVTSCNAAELCTSAQTDEVIIDSTPPHQGGFTSDLKWRNFLNGTSEVTLFWHSFADAESGVDVFYITVSRDYSGSELSDGVISREIVNGSTPIQDGTFHLKEKIHQNDKLYLTIWAKNNAGLNSSVSRISVNALVTKKDGASIEGRLEIEKHSCKPQFCSGDCTCAVVGKPCEKPTCPSTDSYNHTEVIPKVIVQWGSTYTSENVTTSSACLAVHWSVLPTSNGTRPNISRHEYSISIQGEAFGVGVFPDGRVPWIDVGQRQEVVHCMTEDMTLRHGQVYVFYVRTWTSRDVFFITTSSPILVDQTPPSIKKGAHVRDSDTLCKRDLDLIDWMNTITGCWSNVFMEQQSTIEYYTVALGTSENADDIFPTRNMGLQKSITLTNISLQHGTKYFFTVTAYNSVGLHTALSSDGFTIDMDTPRKGVVYNTNTYKNAEFQSDTTTFSLSWTGFSDDQSGIRSYQVALVGDLGVNNGNETFHDVQLKSQYTFRGVNLQPGMMYHGLVKAVDATGHESAIVTSPGRVIDNTGPEGFQYTHFDQVRSVELSANHNMSLRALLTTHFIKNRLYKINGTIYNPDTNIAFYIKNGDNRVRVPFAVRHDSSINLDHSFLSQYTGTRSIELSIESARGIQGNVALWQCNGTNTTRGSSIDVKQIGPTLLTVTVNVRDMESGVYKVLLGVGSTPGGFQIRPFESMSGGNTGLLEIEAAHGTRIHVTAVTENYAGLKSTFYSSPLVLDHTGPELVIVDASITPVNETTDDFNGSEAVPVMVDITWSVADRESGVQRCFCSFGHFPGSGDLMSYRPADSNSYCTSDVFLLSHGTSIHGNVRCVNNVQVKTETTTSEIKVIYDPPSEVHAQVNVITMGTSRVSEVIHQINGSHGDLAFQPSLDRLAFEWFGFVDSSGIANYEYRLREKNRIIMDWRQTKKSAATLTLEGTTLLTAGKTYSIDVMAVNKAGLRSIPRQALIMVDDRIPQLTGNQPLLIQYGRIVRIDWRFVFRPHSTFPCLYSVVMGTREGYPDVADIQDTMDTEAEVELKVTGNDGDAVQEINIGVECVYPTGLSRMVTFNHRLD